MSLASTPLSFKVEMRALALSLLAARASLALAERVSTPSTTWRVSGVPFTIPTPRAAIEGRPLSVDTEAAGVAPAAFPSLLAQPARARTATATTAATVRAGRARSMGASGDGGSMPGLTTGTAPRFPAVSESLRGSGLGSATKAGLPGGGASPTAAPVNLSESRHDHQARPRRVPRRPEQADDDGGGAPGAARPAPGGGRRPPGRPRRPSPRPTGRRGRSTRPANWPRPPWARGSGNRRPATGASPTPPGPATRSTTGCSRDTSAPPRWPTTPSAGSGSTTRARTGPGSWSVRWPTPWPPPTPFSATRPRSEGPQRRRAPVSPRVPGRWPTTSSTTAPCPRPSTAARSGSARRWPRRRARWCCAPRCSS